jgi:hypothetical protein
MAEVVSLEGAVEMIDGNLAIFIPLEAVGPCSHHSPRESAR